MSFVSVEEFTRSSLGEQTPFQRLLYALFDGLNDSFFDGMLKRPYLLSFPVSGCSSSHVFGSYYAPDVAPLGFNDHTILIDFDEICEHFGKDSRWYMVADTLAHEMVHYWCNINGITDTFSDGAHNELFRDAALAHGLECEERDGNWGATGFGSEGWLRFVSNVDPWAVGKVEEFSDGEECW